ncbi:aldo-keto reductase AKR2E4-like [Choristoneura fumiferana]|uniref:aldo-keto reductase AKR2E4-like n=1 Tax=Choristoneura fumiferana TaxID=7141 RepID=UPI003D15F05C
MAKCEGGVPEHISGIDRAIVSKVIVFNIILFTSLLQVIIPSFKLNSGHEIPALGYGTWLGINDKDEFDYSDWDKMLKTLSYCIDVGYRHIDTAHLYRVEPDIGEVVNRKIKEGVVTREEMFITTKVWQHFHREADVEVSVRGSLRRLGLEYLDMVLVHWPMSISEEGVDEKIDYLETWRGFESVLSKGLVRSIGVSNFNVEQLKRLVANCKVKPAVNQVELNLAFGQKELVDYCNTQNIKITAWAPFGAMITSRAPPDAPGPRVDDLTLVAIAKKYGKTVMQVTLRYLYQRGIITIPKTVTPGRVLENASIFDFELTTSEFSTIAKFDVNYRSNRPTFWQNYTNYPFEKYDVPESPIPESLRKWKNGKNNDME